MLCLYTIIRIYVHLFLSFKAVSGSAAQSSSIQCFDVGLGIEHGDGNISLHLKINFKVNFTV